MYPMEGNAYVGPDYEERADIIRMEFDRRAPKLRLSIFAYLVENGMTLADTNGPERFIDVMQAVTDFVSADVVEYANDVAQLAPPTLEDDVPEVEDGGPYL